MSAIPTRTEHDLLGTRGAFCAGLATALNPYIGYENATRVAQEALRTGRGIAELVLEMGLMDRAELEAVLQPQVLTRPKPAPVARALQIAVPFSDNVYQK